MKQLILTSDGGAHPNPGEATWGFCIMVSDDLEVWVKGYGKLNGSRRTNNDAEYSAMVFGLMFIHEHLEGNMDFDEVLCRTDSELMVHHNMKIKDPATGKMRWMSKASKPALLKLRSKLWETIDKINKTIKMKWIPGEQNDIAHWLTEEGMLLAQGITKFMYSDKAKEIVFSKNKTVTTNE